MDNSRKVETLSLAERISVRTNMVDWLLLTPNVGVEFDILKHNWNRYAVNLNLRYRPDTKETFAQPFHYDIFEAVAEGRVYWRERQAQSAGYLRPHRNLWDKLWSCRTSVPSHPKWIFYRGIYVGYADYDIYFKGYSNLNYFFRSDGGRWSGFLFGGSWGFIKPFLAFENGNSLDMEFGLSAGWWFRTSSQKYDRVVNEVKDDEFKYKSEAPLHTYKLQQYYPLPREIHVGLVYRFGNYPIQKKYRWRYDVDMDYRAKIDSLYESRTAGREHKFIRDSLYKVVAKDFRLIYDSVLQVRQQEAQQAIDARAPKRVETADTKKNKKSKKSKEAARKDD